MWKINFSARGRNYSRFSESAGKLKERDAGALGIGFQERAASSDAQLLPVRIESGASLAPVRIFLPQGASIEASGRIDRRALVELLGAIREAQLC